MYKLQSIIAITAIALFASCDKTKDNVDNNNNNNTPKAKTKTELLSAGKWKLTALTESYEMSGQKVTEDYYKDMEDCSKDDFMIFSAAGKVVFDEGPTKCDPDNDQAGTADWVFYDNEKKLIIDEGTRPDTVILAELTESVLTLSTMYTDNGVEFTLSRKYGRIN